MQVFGPGQGGQQPSPTAATHNLNALQRSPPNSRLLPSPPHPPAAHEPEREITPPHPQNVPAVNYPRPINRVPPPQFLTKLDENWQMTDELMAEIERADLQQAQSSAHPYHRDSPPKLDPAVERLRAAERVSPKDLDGQQPRRQPLRESSKSRERERQPTSPTAPSFVQATRTPENGSPSYHTPLQSPGDHEYSYNPYQNHDHSSPSQVSLTRRTSNAAPSDSRTVLLGVGTQGQTPPLQAMSVNARTPDRSLPVQEEQEDDVSGTLHSVVASSRDHYGDSRGPARSSSPTPSSDLNPEGLARYDANALSHGGRDSRAGHREDDDEDTLIDQDQELTVRPRGTHPVSDEEEGYTPRSPQSGLPPDHALEPDRFPRYASQNATIRARTRNGSTDQLGLHGFDPAIFAQADKGSPDIDRPPPQYVEQRRDSRDAQQGYQQQSNRYDPRVAAAVQPMYPQHMHPDDVQHYMDHPTIQSYFTSPRPDAPIPPTPHSQTAAPSPSPSLHNAYDDRRKDYPPFSPVVPAGSPYPYPFNHVRRNHSYPYASRAPPLSAAYDPNHPSAIQEQLARQWQVYAQNQTALAGGHISDSTFSPAATPFQGNATAYNPWAYLHTNRTLGGAGGVGRHDLRSMQSSPSHEPVALPIPPTVGVRKKDRPVQDAVRKPPPRVESTQPRSTPSPDSSGEETAGEPEEAPRFAVPEEGTWVAPIDPSEADWVDEEEDGDGEDLLELEYHPTFVSNVEKRRRRWDMRWDALVQAFNALDRQTDATLVLLAAPSHSTKLHSLTSRSVKRNPSLAQSPTMTNIRVGFRHIAVQRRTTRSLNSSLADRFMVSSNQSGNGSDDTPREEDLKRALGTALSSLGALKGIYEQREARWAEEMHRINDDRERVELLLRQVLGEEPSTPGRAP
ncbi:hypothetical protein B0H15DRAFT_785231 [Mycena belliarum]|uniref:Uncharacterized protein n=1 Tax=Mycena belliarum TaxID=1033014 RepID=A0AAD6TYV6_9AGAR|nr:hypothetical protein B0H15DRAFT_785231 [Mycena belliae]